MQTAGNISAIFIYCASAASWMSTEVLQMLRRWLTAHQHDWQGTGPREQKYDWIRFLPQVDNTQNVKRIYLNNVTCQNVVQVKCKGNF